MDSEAGNEVKDMMNRIMREVENEMFYGISSPREKLMCLLNKLGIKSANSKYEYISSLENLVKQLSKP